MNDFDRQFRSTRRTVIAIILAQLLIYAAFIAGVGWLIFYAINAFSA